MKSHKTNLSGNGVEVCKPFPCLTDSEHIAANKLRSNHFSDLAPVLRIEATASARHLRYRVLRGHAFDDAFDSHTLSAILSRYLIEHIVGDIYAYELFSCSSEVSLRRQKDHFS